MRVQHTPQRNEALLMALLFEVNLARTAFRAGRGQSLGPTGRPEHAKRAADLASAMEKYADAAASAGVPLPYRYRDELRLYQAITRDPLPIVH
jgi:hypothetical protein